MSSRLAALLALPWAVAVSAQSLPVRSPLSIVEGVVLDAVTERPVAGAAVTTESDESAGRGALTDAQGRFKLGGLRAGMYRFLAVKSGYLDGAFGRLRSHSIGVQSTPETAPVPPPPARDGTPRIYVTTLHPSDQTQASATRIRARSGERLEGVDIRLMPAEPRRLTGRVRPAPPPPPNELRLELKCVSGAYLLAVDAGSAMNEAWDSTVLLQLSAGARRLALGTGQTVELDLSAPAWSRETPEVSGSEEKGRSARHASHPLSGDNRSDIGYR